MTPDQLKNMLDHAGRSKRGTAKVLEIDERTMRKYCAGNLPIPKPIQIAVRCLCEGHDQGPNKTETQ